MQRMLLAMLAMAAVPVGAAQVSGLDASPTLAAAYPAQVSTHFAWADVLRVDPVYAMVSVPQPAPDCSAVRGKIPGNSDLEGEGAVSGIGSDQGGAAKATDSDTDSTPGACRVAAQVHEERRLDGYDVEYRYRGEVYLSRLDYDPGERLRVRVSVSPAN